MLFGRLPTTEGNAVLFAQASQLLPSQKVNFPRKPVFIFNSVSVQRMSPLCLSPCTVHILLGQNRQDAAKVYRNVSWEVHVESLGIHFTKGGESHRGYVGAEKEM